LDSKAEKLNGVLVRTIENANGETETKTFNAVGNTLTHRISSNDGNKTEIISGEQSTVVEQTPLGLSISKPESNSTCSLNLGTIANVFPATVCSFDVSTNSGTSTSLSIVDQGSSGFRVNIHDFLTIHKPTSLLANTSCSGNLTLFGNLTMSSVAGTATLKNTSCTGLSVNGITNLNSLANTQSINASGDITTTEFVNCANLLLICSINNPNVVFFKSPELSISRNFKSESNSFPIHDLIYRSLSWKSKVDTLAKISITNAA
jgi:hypothetical protein